MKRTIVHSSTLRSVGYDEDNHILELEFASKEVYRYYNVSGGIYLGLMIAQSKGSFFNVSIKDKYEYKKLKAPSFSIG